MNQTDKRQLLADVLTGNVEALRQYQSQRWAQEMTYRWFIDARAIGDRITAIDKQGNQSPISIDEFEQLARPASVWRIIDHSGGMHIPEPDEDY